MSHLNVFRLPTLLLLLSVLRVNLFAQDIVVSEYFNNPGPSAAKEWTELLVVKDNLNIVGWTVHDHSDFNPITGPVFKDHQLFRNLRAGTIIVIDHRLDSPPQKIDTVADDGFLLLYQHDARFFTNGGSGLDINQPGELIIIEDDNGKAVHALGHFNKAAIQPTAYTNLTCPKVAHDAPSQLSNNHSNRVTGRSLAAYGAGIGTDSTSYGPQVITAPAEDPGTGPSKGLPNLIDNTKRLAKRTNTNQLFWRETRQPSWSATPGVSVNSSDPSSNVLSWTALTDPHVSDKTTGYLILRDTAGFAPATFPGVRDGAIYVVGQTIGTADVIAIQSTKDGTTLTDAKAPCGSTFTYRVYGYRYSADDMMPVSETVDTTARGRQYTETSYAESSTITKPKPPKPTIFVTRPVICPGDTTTLWTDATNGVETYTWLRNGTPLPIGFTVSGTVRQPGTYRLIVTAPGGCTAVSNDIEVLPMPAPTVTINLAGLQSLCIGDTLWLNVVTKAQGYELIKNGIVIKSQPTPRFALTEPGVFAVRIKTGTQCDGVSNEVTVTVPDVQFHFLPDTIDFGKLGQCQTSAIKTVQLVNDGTQPITIASVTMPPGFALAFPAPGFVVAPGKQQEIQVLFSPAVPGITAGTAQATATPCSIANHLRLTGERTTATTSLNRVDVDFGTYSTCNGSNVKDSIRFELTNSGSADITVSPPVVSAPFYTAFSKVVLKPGETVPILVRYLPFGADLNRAVTQTIAFPYKDALCADTLKATATLRAACFQPSIELLTDTVFTGTSNSCQATMAGTITLRNTGNVPTTVSHDAGGSTTYSGLPLVIPPGQTRSILMQFDVSGGSGTYSITDTLTVEPCKLAVPVVINATLIPPTYSFPNLVNLKTALLCPQESSPTASLTVVPSSTFTGATVRSVTLEAPFSTNIVPGDSVGDSLVVSITYTPVIAGTDNKVLTIVLDPCGDTLIIELNGAALSVLRSTVVDNADFGTVSQGSSTQRRLVIENTGTSALLVNKLSNVIPPWTVLSEVPSLPATLAENDSAVIVLEYQFLDYDRLDTLKIGSAVSAGKCSDSVELVLTGASESAPENAGPITGVTLVLPSNVVVAVGQDASIPVSLIADSSLVGRGLKSFEATLSYNPTLFRPSAVVAIAPSVTSASIVEVSPGTATLSIQSATELVESEPLVQIGGHTYLGNSTTTPLHVDTIVCNQAEIAAQNGMITVVGDCSITTQTIEFGLEPSIVFNGVYNSRNTIGITFTTLTNDAAHFSIVNGSGQVVYKVDVIVQPGVHTIEIASSLWPSGWYGLAMQHGFYNGSATFLLFR